METNFALYTSLCSNQPVLGFYLGGDAIKISWPFEQRLYIIKCERISIAPAILVGRQE